MMGAFTCPLPVSAAPQKRILLIDNEPGFTEMVKLALEQTRNYVVEEENDSAKAILTARRFRPDLIFLDVMMPDLDGGDIAQQVDADSSLRGTPIIFLTSLVSKDEATSAPLLGGYRFIAKPARMSQIVSCAEELLQ